MQRFRRITLPLMKKFGQRLAPIITIALFSWVPAMAQNQDIGVLFGIAASKSDASVGTIVSSSQDVSLQIDYSFQWRTSRLGAFYIELPLAGVNNSSDVVGAAIISANDGIFFFTPGVRLKSWLGARVSPYVSVGGGMAVSTRNRDIVGTSIISNHSSKLHPAFAAGGGVDFRMSRLLSLRGEVRDYVTAPRLGGVSGRNHVLAQMGIGFHF